MSWTMWHVEGVGFDCSNAEPDNYRNMIVRHEDSLRQTMNKRYADELLYYLTDGCLDNNGVAVPELEEIREIGETYTVVEPIVKIMEAETGIRFCAPGFTDDGEDYLLFEATYPWQYNETERTLTLEKVKEIMQVYADELGLTVEEDVDLIYAG